jgi:hypothetical protein
MLRTEGLTELKNSILANGFLDFERIVVQPYEPVDGLFLVIEGNRRVAAFGGSRTTSPLAYPFPRRSKMY